jgi:hypothetical protein
MTDASLRETSWKLLAKEGFAKDFTVELLKGGKNNRVYRVASSEKVALLKAYFRHPGDPRDRFSTEFNFSLFAWSNGLSCIPKPLHGCQESGLALYEFVDGEKLTASKLSADAVRAARGFFKELNSHRLSPQATELQPASEACFSLASHIQLVDQRVSRLLAASKQSALSPEAEEFVHSKLAKTWALVSASTSKLIRQLDLPYAVELAPDSRRLSPSDFGFHNALRRSSGQICFLDFEYSGWDDIAKTTCDFFLQPAVPVPAEFFNDFVEELLEDFADRHLERERIRVLLPVYHVKWACILMNDFLPVGGIRRGFSLGLEEDQERRIEQLRLAEAVLKQVESAEERYFCRA